MSKKYLPILLISCAVFAFFLFPKQTKESFISPEPLTLPTPTVFPDKYLIKAAFIEQAPEKNWDQPWQDACEEAALLTVDFFYKNQRPNQKQTVQAILAMIDFENQQGFTHDVNINQMAQIAAQYLGYQTKIIDNPDLLEIKQYLNSGIPVIIPANGKILYQENRHFTNGGPYYHNLVILGFNDQKFQFTVHDVGTRHGAYFKYSYQLLLDSIHDFPISDHKEDINQGAKKALILLK